MKSGIKVMDAMTINPVIVHPDELLKDCSQKMAEQHVGALIVKENNKVHGICTEQDIVRKTVALGKNPLRMKVKEIMDQQVKTITPDKDIFEALLLMRDLNIRHLPVVEGNQMIGLLTIKDILKIQPELFDLLVEKFELREEERKPISRVREKEGICQVCGDYTEELNEHKNVFMCSSCYKQETKGFFKIKSFLNKLGYSKR